MHHALSLNERDDLNAQGGLLDLVLSHHPTSLTAEELEPQFSGGADAFERALRDLVAAGLLRREGESVLPTYAALTFDRVSV
jgi:predicted HTH transcriptional regulator